MTALLTDLYQLTMLDAYDAEGMDAPATFEMFVRRLPPGRAFLGAAGLEQVLSYLEGLAFRPDEVDWLRDRTDLSPRLLERLRALRFTGDVDAMPEGEFRTGVPAPPAHKAGLGYVEGWRGPVLLALTSGPEGTIRRCHPHDPSWSNWPVLEHAVIGNIVPDFPLINKSFNLSYSGQDR